MFGLCRSDRFRPFRFVYLFICLFVCRSPRARRFHCAQHSPSAPADAQPSLLLLRRAAHQVVCCIARSYVACSSPSLGGTAHVACTTTSASPTRLPQCACMRALMSAHTPARSHARIHVQVLTLSLTHALKHALTHPRPAALAHSRPPALTHAYRRMSTAACKISHAHARSSVLGASKSRGCLISALLRVHAAAAVEEEEERA